MFILRVYRHAPVHDDNVGKPDLVCKHDDASVASVVGRVPAQMSVEPHLISGRIKAFFAYY